MFYRLLFVRWVCTPRCKNAWRCSQDATFVALKEQNEEVVNLCFLHDVFFKLMVFLVTRCLRILEGPLLSERLMISLHSQIMAWETCQCWRMMESRSRKRDKMTKYYNKNSSPFVDHMMHDAKKQKRWRRNSSRCGIWYHGGKIMVIPFLVIIDIWIHCCNSLIWA